jgi:hypothetical protein
MRQWGRIHIIDNSFSNHATPSGRVVANTFSNVAVPEAGAPIAAANAQDHPRRI